MAKTPRKDYRRREREQKKADKRRAREEAKAKKRAANPSPPATHSPHAESNFLSVIFNA